MGFGPGGLRAPCVFACAIRSLAIVITIVQSLLAQAACVRHTCLRAPCVAWPLLLPLFSLSLFLFPPSSAFDPLRGNSHVRNHFLSSKTIKITTTKISSSYAKIWGETNFQPREFPQSGSKVEDVIEKKKRERKNESQ